MENKSGSAVGIYCARTVDKGQRAQRARRCWLCMKKQSQSTTTARQNGLPRDKYGSADRAKPTNDKTPVHRLSLPPFITLQIYNIYYIYIYRDRERERERERDLLALGLGLYWGWEMG
jgi:hypothetical protein